MKITPRMLEEAVQWVRISGNWRRQGYRCDTCGDDMLGPMLEHELWKTIAHHHREVLCEACMEVRLGRKIQVWDMNGSWWNVYRCSFILVFNSVTSIWENKRKGR
jgi:hypothetical protein